MPRREGGGEALCPGPPASKSKTTNLNRPAHNNCPAETVVTVNRTDINIISSLESYKRRFYENVPSAALGSNVETT